MTTTKVLRVGVLIVTAASLVHVSLLLPKYLTLVGQATGWGRVPAGAVFVAFLAAVAGSLLAIVLLARSWARPEVRALAVFMAAAGASWGAILRLTSFSVEDGGGISAYTTGGFLDAYVLMAGLLLVSASFMRFSALFPTALSEQAIPRHGRSRFLRRMRVRLLRPGLVWGLGVAGPMVVVGLLAVTVFIAQAMQSGGAVTVEGWTAAPVTVVALLFPVAAMVFGVQNLTTGYLGADEGDRRKLLWLLVGVAVSTWMILLPILTIPVAVLLLPSAELYGDLSMVLWGLAPGVLVSAVGVAVFYTGAVDPRLVLRRSTVLGVLGTVWVVLFAALESFMSQWLSTAFGVPEVVISVAAALLAAVLALPFRRVVAVLTTRVASAQSHATETRA